jgi:AraC-like DNA-binding protein
MRVADAFHLSYWPPAPALAAYVTGYHSYCVEVADEFSDVLFPGWAAIRFTRPPGAWRVRLGNRCFDPVPEASLFGASSYAGYSSGRSGAVVGAGLTPVGWRRLIGGDASRYANKVVPLRAVLGDDAATLAGALAEGAPPVALFDDYFTARLEQSRPERPELQRLVQLVSGGAAATATDVARIIGIHPRALIKLCKLDCGFAPKLLLRRARFMRAAVALVQRQRGAWVRAIAAAGYFDQSHFVRDCQLFLGMSWSEFATLPKPLNDRTVELRRRALGASVQALHGSDDPSARLADRQL